MANTTTVTTPTTTISPWLILLPVGLGTGLSLLGDSSLYTVLPIHAADAGVALVSVGVLLSANRWIRLLLNGPVGLAYERWPRRRLFVPALFIGALSTALYAFTQGFWPLLVGRLLWGVSWAGMWIGGNTIILDVTGEHNRGRWVGAYQVFFFLGVTGGALLGGISTDWLGYHLTMTIAAGLTLLGAVIALIMLPETQGGRLRILEPVVADDAGDEQHGHRRERRPHPGHLGSVATLLAVNRLVVAGMLIPTFSLYLAERFGEQVQVGEWALGVASLAGLLLGANAVVSMGSSPLFGRLSDGERGRWPVVAVGLLPGVMGLGILALVRAWWSPLGLLLAAVAGGSNQGLSTALVGDLSGERNHSRQLGLLFTLGDLASAVGPPLAFWLHPLVGIEGVYGVAGSVFLGMLLLAAWEWRQAGRAEHSFSS